VIGQQLAITTAVLEQPNGGHGDLVYRCTASQQETAIGEHEFLIRYNKLSDNLGVTGSLQWLYEHTTAPIIAFLHSDCEIFEQGWDERALREFDDPKVGVVGFGGATQLGHDDLYKTPYKLQQLARFGYASNTKDAEQHGERFEGSRDVAVLDGFSLIIRRTLLDKVGGWPVKETPFHMYDAAICCLAHEAGYRVRLCGILSLHHGGATSTTSQYQEFSLRQYGKSDAQVHEESHKYIYERFRKVLPWHC